MLLTPNGQVLTNNHVVAGATRIWVTVEGRPGALEATVLGAAPLDDVALLQVRGASSLPTVRVATSSGLRVGDEVVALGHPSLRGDRAVLTTGEVTALGRDVLVGPGERLQDLIETDAPVRPGESGGALVNAVGEVVGMITASERTAFDRVRSSFAIPVERALEIVEDIRAGRESHRVVVGPAAFLGVAVRDLDPSTASRVGVDAGALVVGVVPGSPADRAGLRDGSVITRVAGEAVTSVGSLRPAIYTREPGKRVTVTWVDATGVHTTSVTLAEGPAV
ncbi:MAG TPA: trypsin-like peptidase domain-containing protein [Actinomycetota bacterium]|nr:trypsin-like peptidase domain-containing protein [Actinomycetota bacterium]